MMTTIFGQKCVLADPDTHKFLVLQRSNYKHDGGVRDFVGGKVDTGEDAKASLRREAQEEAKILLHNFTPIDIISYTHTDNEFFIFALWGCTDRSLPEWHIELSHEHTTYARVTPQEFLALPLRITVERVKKQVVDYIAHLSR